MKRRLYIAHHANEGPVNVVLAPDRETANVYWQGLGLHPSAVEELDPDAAEAYAVIAVVGIRNVSLRDDHRRPVTARVMVRGRGETP